MDARKRIDALKAMLKIIAANGGGRLNGCRYFARADDLLRVIYQSAPTSSFSIANCSSFSTHSFSQ
jgi:hypothetical protein